LPEHLGGPTTRGGGVQLAGGVEDAVAVVFLLAGETEAPLEDNGLVETVA
jgi:hypothetical protein